MANITNDEKLEVLNFIKKHSLGVISTVNEADEPQAAVIGFGETDSFQLIFGTYNSSRKYKNLKSKPNVAFVIGWDEGATVQYEGIARELSGSEADHFAELYFEKSPSSRQYKDHPEERYFVVEPKWVRYTDLKFDPWRILEIQF